MDWASGRTACCARRIDGKTGKRCGLAVCSLTREEGLRLLFVKGDE